MKTIRLKISLFLLLGVILALPLSKTVVHLLTEIWWFQSVGFVEVFWTRVIWQVLLWVITFLLYGGFLWANYRVAMHQTRHIHFQFAENRDFIAITDAFANFTALIVIGLISLTAATASAAGWEMILKFLHPSPFADRDPIFQQNIGFYIFQLPLYEGIRNWLWGLLGSGLVLSGVVYGFKGRVQSSVRSASPRSHNAHLNLLLAAIAGVGALSFWLDRYGLLYSSEGSVYGVGYTDAHARMIAYGIMSVLSLGLAGLFILSLRPKWSRLLSYGIGGYIVAMIVLNGLYPWVQQKFLVEPNELGKEKSYLAYNIQATQKAYNLQDVQSKKYAAETQLNRQSLEANQSTIRNIRLWDQRPLLSTYRQLQEIRSYYNFSGVDVDRYTLNGDYQQVMLSGRELVATQLPQEAQTWVNQRLKYTHGYGLVMNPVSRVTSDGLPELYLKDIPPVSQIDLPLSQAAIYYGESTDPYIFTGTTTDEFDYPLGNTNAFTRYSGKGGVAMASIAQRLAYAYELGSLPLLLSNYFTDQSRIHYYRRIMDRVSHIAPFLRWDSDPYLTVIQGRLQWIIDAYTVSDRYPYAEPVAHTKDAATILRDSRAERLLAENINYLRNAVKVVVDAYDGTVQFLIVDETDPILATYRRIFPHLFTSQDAISATVKAHFRYPQDLFKVQSQMYSLYHMSDPEVFYNREDLWHFPMQIYEGNEVLMQPYYTVMRLPGETQEGFILIQPFTPANKDNMIAWMAARSNGQNYGKVLLYEFPKQKLVYGPRQIEARIDQDTQISQQLTLWSQAGSKVIRGDLLVIPIEQSLLYVEPVYLRAEQGELPELKRVIVAYDKTVVMTETLEQSLATIFGGAQTKPEISGSSLTELVPLVKSALATYQKAEAAARRGNWAEYGRYQQELAELLQRLNREK
jgi:uncharacterized protein